MTPKPRVLSDRRGPRASATWLFAVGLVGALVAAHASGAIGSAWTGLEAFIWIPAHAAAAGSVILAVYRTLAMTSPAVHVTVSPDPPTLGQELTVAWDVPEGAERLRNLELSLEAVERAQVPGADEPDWVENRFQHARLARVRSGSELRRGEARVRLPADSMHSFRCKRVQIRWRIRVRADVSRGPDVRDVHALEVRPPAGESA